MSPDMSRCVDPTSGCAWRTTAGVRAELQACGLSKFHPRRIVQNMSSLEYPKDVTMVSSQLPGKLQTKTQNLIELIHFLNIFAAGAKCPMAQDVTSPKVPGLRTWLGCWKLQAMEISSTDRLTISATLTSAANATNDLELGCKHSKLANTSQRTSIPEHRKYHP